jgi:hypothetical protein
MKTKIIFFSILLISVSILFAENRIYKSPKYSNNITISQNGDGFTIITRSMIGTTTTDTNSKFETVKWMLVNEKDNTNVVAELKKGIIYVAGIYKGKEIKKENKTNNLPWHQSFPTDMEGFAKTGAAGTNFIAIAPEGPFIFQVGKFNVKKISEDTITVKGQPEDTIQYKFEVPPFWGCQVWFRKSDGKYLRFKDGDDVSDLQ